MALTGVNLRSDVFCGVVMLPSCVLTGFLCYQKTLVYLTALPLLVFAGVTVAKALQDFFQGKQTRRSQRVRAHSGASVMRISRSLYDQLDSDMLRLLASNRDFDSDDYARLLQLDNISHGGATESEIGRLPLVPVTEQMLQASNHADCSICLMGIDVDSHVRLLRCFHHFHPECIDPWLKGKIECPMCKFPAIGPDRPSMGLGSKMYAPEKLEKLLRGAKVTQQSIQTVSHWMLENRAFLADMVDVWTRLLREGDANHQIVNLYIANDAMQIGARKYGKQIVEAFESKLLEVAEFVMASCDEKVKRCLMKIVGIWKQRNIVNAPLLQMLQNVSAGKLAVDPAMEAEAMVDVMRDEQAEREAFVKQLVSDESIEQALEELPEVAESEFTATTSQRLQNLSSATISADLLSDRMFQLESSLSSFHQACDAFQPNSSDGGDKGEGADFEVVSASAGDIVWESMEQQVFDLDIEKSRDHVQQYRDNLEEQSAKREELLEHLQRLQVADLFAEPLFASSMDALDDQCRALEKLYFVCADAETIEKQREAEKQAAYLVNSRMNSYTESSYSRASSYEYPSYTSTVDSTSTSNSRFSSYDQRYGNDGENGGAPVLRRHSSSGSNGNGHGNGGGYYGDEDRYGMQSKRPRLQHSHSVGEQSDSSRSRWQPPADEYRPPYRDENRYSPPRGGEPSRYSPSRSNAPQYRSGSRWDMRPDYARDRERRW